MFLEIVSGSDWDLRLLKTGQFVLRFEKRFGRSASEFSFSQSVGWSAAEVFGGLFRKASDEDLLFFRAVLVAALPMDFEARRLQHEYRALHRKAVAAGKARKAVEAVALLAAIEADGDTE
jgi:hypothetical protein